MQSSSQLPRLRTGLIVVAVALSFLLFIAFERRSHEEFKRWVVGQTNELLLTTARTVSLAISESVGILSDSLGAVAYSDTVRRSLLRGTGSIIPSSEIDALWQSHRQHAAALVVLDASGRVVYRSPEPAARRGETGDALAERPDVAHVLRQRTPFVSQPFAVASGDLVVSVSRPIVADGRFVGVAQWLIDVKTLSRRLASPVRIGRSGHLHLVDGAGVILAAADGAQVGRPALEKPRRLYPDHDWSVLERLLREMAAGREGAGIADLVCWRDDSPGPRIAPRLYVHAPVHLGDSDWSVLVTLDRDEIWGPVREHGLTQIATLLLTLTVATLAGQRWLAAQRRTARTAAARKFQTIFESMQDGVALHEIVADEGGAAVDYRILEINPAFVRHTGIRAADARGALGSALYGRFPPPFLETYAAVANSGAPHSFETYFEPLKRHFSISVVSPDPGLFATVFQDVTDRKRREEELRQKNAELERFVYTISHDLKSPLVTVKTFLGYLEQDLAAVDHAKVAEDVSYISTATARMGTLLEELLEFSRVGRSVAPPSRVTFNELVDEALRMVAGRIAGRGIEVRVHAADVALLGDRRRLVEIWQNLIDNAAKYLGEQAGPLIEIGAETRGAETLFFVLDNGIGIDPRYHDKVFGLFEKLDQKSEGTGLGLALVRRIVELYQGTIRVESGGAGTGSRFVFTLPAAVEPRGSGK